MNKDNLIELILKEIKEMEVLAKGLSGFENIPDIMFRLSDSKVNNIKDLFDLLEKDNKEASTSIETIKKEEIVEKLKEEVVELQEIIEPVNITIEKTESEIEFVETPVMIETENEISVTETTIIVEKSVVKEELKSPEKTTDSHKKHIIGETIIERKSSVNESLSSKTSSIEKTLAYKKIEDLKKAINLNDKFRFQRELFKGNANLMNQTLDVLNEAANKTEALDFLSSFEWNMEEQTVAEFMELVNRKFIE